MNKLNKTIFFKNLNTSLDLEVLDCKTEYRIEAIHENGYDLCNIRDGKLKRIVEKNTKLRSDKSKQKEINSILETLINTISTLDSKNIIFDKKTVKAKIVGGVAHHLDGSGYTRLENIKSLESNEHLSWNPHNVYNSDTEIEIHIKRGTDQYLEYTASELQLYDLFKLSMLVNTEDFKNRKYSFFNYGEALRLLGFKNIDNSKISGLF